MARITRRSRSGRYDLVVVGMGSGGTVAAEFAARELGLRVAAVERDRVGGDCLWTGCVPSKTLLASAKVAQVVRHANHFAIGAAGPVVDLAAVWRRVAAVQAEIAATDDDPERFRRLGVDMIAGEARITGPHEVVVGDRVLATRYVLVCTGSRPLPPPIDGLDGVEYLTSENLFDIARPPDSLIVIGGGPIGCELAQALNRLGIEVTMVEIADRLLPRDDPAHARRLLDVLRGEGLDIQLGSTAATVRKGGDGVIVRLASGERVTAQGMLVATGRQPNVEALHLEGLGVEVERTGIVVDHRSRTAVPTIYAVGDVTGRSLFTHAAAYAAVLAVRDMFLPGRGNGPDLVPWCTFTDPEVAHAGMTEAEAVEHHGRRKVQVHRRDLEHSDRARADNTTDGEIAIVTAGRKIVGAHAICPRAGELIHELALAIRAGLGLGDLAEMVHIYPTLSTEIGRLAGESAYATARRYRHLAKVGRLRR